MSFTQNTTYFNELKEVLIPLVQARLNFLYHNTIRPSAQKCINPNINKFKILTDISGNIYILRKDFGQTNTSKKLN